MFARTNALSSQRIIPDDLKRRQIRAFFARIDPEPPAPPQPELLWARRIRLATYILVPFGVISSILLLTNGAVEAAIVLLVLSAVAFVLNRILHEHIRQAEMAYKLAHDQYASDLANHVNLLNSWHLSEYDITKIPAGSQIDRWLTEDIARIANEVGLESLGFVAEHFKLDSDRGINPFYGPLLESVYAIPDFQRKKFNFDVNSLKLRFPCYQVVVLYLTEERIAVFATDFNFLYNSFHNTRTYEYMYHDIVSISTEDKEVKFDVPLIAVHGPMTTATINMPSDPSLFDLNTTVSIRVAKIFRLSVPSSDSMSVVIAIPEIREEVLTGRIHPEIFEPRVQYIRSQLRKRQQANANGPAPGAPPPVPLQ
ncbi:MAG: hypothetical protein JNJ61_09220 [Anaerolineae bacterium]|nr:hypothetical protein [Anaerolineae bacterium]